MTREDLEVIISGGESERVEFKKSTGQRTAAAKAICGMLNGVGGHVLFGVNDSGDAVGQQVSTSTMESLFQELRRIEPQPKLNPARVPLGNEKEVIAVAVIGRGAGPFTYDGRPYVRHGPTTELMSADEYRRNLLEQMHPSHRWETQTAADFDIGDLDYSEITRTIDEAIRRQRMSDPGTREPEHLLEGLGLIRNGRISNAAIVLFGRTNVLRPTYSQCLLRMARFRGVDKGEFLDNRQEVGNAFDLLVRAQRFLRDHLPVAGRIVPDLFERVDDPLYPPAALREALANAFCHRDYSIAGGSVGVAIFDDRLEITSTGELPFGLTPSDLLLPHKSQPWNPLIAGTFYRRA